MANSILFIAQSFPPRPGVAGRRLRFLAERAIEDYEEVFAIRLDRDYEGEQVERAVVTALPARDLRTWLGGDNAGKTVEKAGEPAWKKRLRHLRQSFPFVFLTDDGGYFYRRAAFRIGGDIIEAKQIGVIFSSFRPWSDHLVARRLKKRHPGLRWIADFRDLPVDPVRKDVWWPALQSWWGKRVVKSANEVWVVSEGQREQLAAWHPNIKVVRNALFKLPPVYTAPKTERFTIVYTGSFYEGLQSVDPLVDSLLELLKEGVLHPDKVCLIYRGKDAQLFLRQAARLPAQCTDVQPSIAPAAAQKMQHNAQLLLLLNWSAPDYFGVLTAKLWDYLATGRPILGLVNGPGDRELKQIIEGADAGAVFADGEQGRLTGYLAEKYKIWLETGLLAHQASLEVLRKYL